MDWSDPRLGPSLGVGSELPTQDEFDDRLLLSASNEGGDTAKKEHDVVEQ